MKRIYLSLLALASLTGACDDSAADSLADSRADSAALEFRGLCDEHPISSMLWEGVQPVVPGDEADWCAFIEECNMITEAGKPSCTDYGPEQICGCGGLYVCYADEIENTYYCDPWE